MSASKSDYKGLIEQTYQSVMGGPYSVCANMCANLIQKWAVDAGLGPVKYIVENGQRTAALVVEGLELARQLATVEEPHFRSIHSVRLAGKRGDLPLQGADFLAHLFNGADEDWMQKTRAAIPMLEFRVNKRFLDLLNERERALTRKERTDRSRRKAARAQARREATQKE